MEMETDVGDWILQERSEGQLQRERSERRWEIGVEIQDQEVAHAHPAGLPARAEQTRLAGASGHVTRKRRKPLHRCLLRPAADQDLLGGSTASTHHRHARRAEE